MKKITSIFATVIMSFTLATGFTGQVTAAGDDKIKLDHQDWSFQGLTGTFDKNQLARGFEVFKTVCTSCHGLAYVSFRHFLDIGFTEEELKAIIASGGYEIPAEPDAEGNVEMRPMRLSDYWPEPYENRKAAEAANNGKAPPDLSLMAKARPGGPDYIYSLLTGYLDSTIENAEKLGIAGFQPETQILNAVYPGHVIAMAPPLYGDDVSYLDGTATTIEQEARDVSAFLMWTAEPKLEERKYMGIKVLLFLSFFCFFAYLMHRRLGHKAKLAQKEEGGPWE